MSLAAPDRPKAPFGTRSVEVAEYLEIGPYRSLTLVDSAGPQPRAGQFYMLRTAQRWGGGKDGRPYLPRALSFARTRQSDDGLRLDFLFEVVGPGTARLSELVVGDRVVIAGPFGNGFSVTGADSAILVAGGIGLAPIVALSDQLAVDGGTVISLVGMRSAGHAAAVDHFALDCTLTTDDGSAGEAGLVTDLLERQLADSGPIAVYACGPAPMLEAVRSACGRAAVPAQLAMEAPMACGFGACHGCVVETTNGYLRLCVDGPVVDAAALSSALAPEAGRR